MTEEKLVPELVLVPPGAERLLPDVAEGEVEVWAGNDGFEAYGYAAGGHYWAHLPGIAAFRFLADRSDVVAFPDHKVRPDLVEDAYNRNVLPLVLHLRGYEVLHASAVSTRKGLVVLCGISGTGKSTFAYSLSKRGYAVWADDAVPLDLDAEEISAFQVPFQLRLESDAAMLFDCDGDAGTTEDMAPSRSPVIALLILERSETPDAPLVDVRRFERTDAFTALLPHAYFFQLSDAARNALMMDRYLRLAARVPTFGIRYRPDLDKIVAVLDEVEARVVAT